MQFDASLDYTELTRRQICPPWIIESKPLIGRCIPSANETSVLPGDLVYNELKKGIVNLANFLDLRGFGERVLHDLVSTSSVRKNTLAL